MMEVRGRGGSDKRFSGSGDRRQGVWLLIPMLVAIGCISAVAMSGCQERSANEVETVSIENNESLDLGLIESSLAAFIREHGRDTELAELALSEQSLAGRRVKERSDLWFLGDWSIQGSPSSLTAIWSTMVGPGEDANVIVRLEKVDSHYRVADWSVEETF